jgi:WD40 repeat protein/tRNA A-37 threonylcarbamoyl transferase component Bud32
MHAHKSADQGGAWGQFGGYELLEEISRGGMGVVYKARQVKLNRIVALKLLLAGRFASKQFVQRFRTEAAAAAVLQHPNIVAVHEVGLCEGQHFFSMDYVDGKDLTQVVGHRPLSPTKAAQYLELIARAIHYAHEQGILHRDLKPSNILVDQNDQPRITDFGLAKRLDSDASLTMTGQLLGSPNFMPPEQAGAGRHNVGRQSDVYALGGILYYLITARPPVQGEDLETIIQQVLHAEPILPRMLNPAVPRDLETICLKCLEKEPSRRYSTALTLAEELARFSNHEPIRARPLGPVGRMWRWCRRKPALAAAVVMLHLVLAAGLSGILWQWRRAQLGEAAARLNLYAADINLAQVALEEGNLGRAYSLLREQIPSSGAEDLRGFEWRYLWQLCQGQESATLRGHNGIASCVAFSSNGSLLATAGFDGMVKVWDWPTRNLITNLHGIDAAICRLALSFSPDGRLLAAAGGTNLIVWDTTNWKPLARLQGDSSPLGGSTYQVVFSPDGHNLAACRQGDVQIWNTLSWQLEKILPGVSDELRNPLAFSPDGKLLASFSSDRVQILDVASGSRLGASQELMDRVFGLAFAPAGTCLAVVEASGKLTQLDAKTLATVARTNAHNGFVQGLAFSPDGKILATCGSDQTIQLWSLDPLKRITALKGHQNEVWAVAFAPNGETLASASKDGTIKLWQTRPPRLPPNLLEDTSFPLWFSTDGQTLLTRHKRGSFQYWNINSGRQIKEVRPLRTTEERTCTTVSADGNIAAIGTRNGRLYVCDLEKAICIGTNDIDANPIVALAFSQDQNTLAVASGQTIHNQWRGATRLVDLRNGQTETLSSEYSGTDGHASVAFSPDGKVLAGLGPNYTVRIWDVTARKLRFSLAGHAWHVVHLSFSPDGRQLVSSSYDNTARIWQVDCGKQLALLSGGELGVIQALFSSDGRTLATTGNNLAVSLWSVAAGRELIQIKNLRTDFVHALFSPDGCTLATGGNGYAVQLWRAPSLAEIDAGEKRLAH